MAITPKQGYIIDPKNQNAVIPDPNVSMTSTVTPNPTGSLQGTMTSVNDAPQTTTPPPAAPGAGMDPTSFMTVLNGVKQNFANNNDLIKQKNLLVKGLFTSPLTQEEMNQLTPDIREVYQKGNRDATELQIQALNERIQGSTNNFADSVNYLVNGYNTSVQQAEKQKEDALDTVKSFVSAYGSRAGEALKSLYGQGFLDTLKNSGIDIDSFASIPTLAEKKAESSGDITFTDTQINTGASRAGLTTDQFKQLDPDVQNLFITNATIAALLVNDVHDVSNGDMSYDEASQDIQSQNIPQSVKDYFIKLLPPDGGNSDGKSGGGFLNWLSEFFNGK